MNLSVSKVLVAGAVLMSAVSMKSQNLHAQNYNDPVGNHNAQIVKSMMQNYDLTEDQIAAVSRDLGITLSQLRNLKNEASQLDSELLSLKNRRQNLRSEIQETQREVQSLEARITDLTRNLRNLRQDNRQLSQDIKQEERALQPLQQELRQKNQAHKNLVQQKNQLNRQISALQSQINQDNKTIKNAGPKIAKNKQQIQKERLSLPRLEQGIKQAKAENRTLQSTVDANMREIHKKQNKLNGLPPKSPERKKVAREIQKLVAENKKASRKIQRNKQQIGRLEKTKGTAERKIAKLQKDNQVLQSSLDQAKRRSASNSSKLAELNRQKSRLEQQVRAAANEKSKAQRNYDQASQKLRRMNDIYSKNERRISEKQANKQNAERRLNQAERDIPRMRQNLVDLRSRSQSVKSQLDQVLVESNRKEAVANRLRQQEAEMAQSLKNTYAYSNRDKVLNVAVGATSNIGESALYQVQTAMSSGKKVVFWADSELSSTFVYNHGQLMGVEQTRLEYASGIQGLNILEGMRVARDIDQVVISGTQDSIPLLVSDRNQVVMAAVPVYEGGYLSNFIVSSGLNAKLIADAKLAKMLRKIANSSPADLMPKDPVDPGHPSDPVDPGNPSEPYVEVVEMNSMSVQIPDNSPSGIDQKIVVDAKEGYLIQNISLELDIVHTYIGDLIIKLVHPSGQEVVLHNKQGGGTDNLSLSVSPEALASFKGLQAAGKYSLVVSDHASRDTGYISAIKMTVEMQ
ncbi:MAG: proprotein convertase P-domain-containing protein [Bdellovibrionota bacterium]|nr:proprotein convertase P-domain-containing protein [Bdellovibrionota bacterium]